MKRVEKWNQLERGAYIEEKLSGDNCEHYAEYIMQTPVTEHVSLHKKPCKNMECASGGANTMHQLNSNGKESN